MSAYTVITKDHLSLLEKHRIALTEHDFVSANRDSESRETHKMIDEAVGHVSQLFGEMRESKKVPLEELHKNIVPILQEASSSRSLFGLITALQAKDDYTYRHNLAVGAYAGLIGNWLGLDHQDHLQLTTAAFLHDVGKMLIPQEILNKPERLTDEEYAMIKKHTVFGYDLLKETSGITERQALPALQHHERMDGSGYPYGLTSNKIDFFSRIVAVADVFHAMTSQRVYRDPSPFYEVLFQMDNDTYGVLDPGITKLFMGKIMNTLIGRTVLLTDGSEGTILMINMHDPLYPLVQIGSSYKNLSEDRNVHIMKLL